MTAPAGALAATTAPDTTGVELFEKRIRPLLAEQCYACHSSTAKSVMGGLVLDTRAGIAKGGDSGAVLVPGKPEQSLLLKAVHHAPGVAKMPPGKKLTDAQIRDLEAWIRMGAPDPRTGEAGPARSGYDWEKERQFWSFQPVRMPAVPAVKDASWAWTDIDRFVLAKLEAKGLKPVADADPRSLIRRVTFDLTGLPPAPEDVEAFVRECEAWKGSGFGVQGSAKGIQGSRSSGIGSGTPASQVRGTDTPRLPNTGIPEHLNTLSPYEKLIDRLLASPAYGERWGRHWLDLVRYADTSGCNSDFPIPTAYRYRNYVIDAFNRDKPYDRFLQEQLAGDLLPAKDEKERHEGIVATGYLALARRFGSQANEFHLTLEDVIDNTGKTMLGLSLGCARCHDHKFDPVPQKDYYALYGIFQSSTFAFPGTEVVPGEKDLTYLATGEQAEAARKYDQELSDLGPKLFKLRREIRVLEADAERAEQAAEAARKSGASGETAKLVRAAEEARQTYATAKAELDRSTERQKELLANPVSIPRAFAACEGVPSDAKVHKKGDPRAPGETVPRGFLQILGGQTLPESAGGSGRLELARWITDPRNPLTARVMVNRIWQGHFGRGLVSTPSDFGARGEKPSHPELLDFLASRFAGVVGGQGASGHPVVSGNTSSRESKPWSVKSIHREILLSRVYQLSCVDDAAGLEADPANTLLWRFNRRRLSAEEIRDSMLAVSGQLDRTVCGEHPFPPRNTWKYTQHRPFYAVYDTNRRSIYLMQQRIKKHPFLEAFDGADPVSNTAARTVSTTAIQALLLMNDPFVHTQAQKLAERVAKVASDAGKRIDAAYLLAYGRAATDEERTAAHGFLRECRAELGKAGVKKDAQELAALASLMRVVLCSNEFVWLD